MNIRVAIVGVGNCCSSLVQAIEASKLGKLNYGLDFKTIGGYAIENIEFVTAFDIDSRKVGKDLSEAIYAQPNCTTKYFSVPNLSIKVQAGNVLDGVSKHMLGFIKIIEKHEESNLTKIVNMLKSTKAELLISYLPVGSDNAAAFYAEAAVIAGCGFINCMPSNIANSPEFQKKFTQNKIPLLGDDIKSQIGSTAIHRSLINILQSKGAKINSTYQLNIGGNTDFMNMRDPERSKGKKFTKEIALKHLFKNKVEIGVGPSDYVPHLKDFKVGYINIEGTALLGMPFSIDMKLKVEDSPNSTAIVIDAIRTAKTALDRGLSGVINEVCPYLFKNPPVKVDEKIVTEWFDSFIHNNKKTDTTRC